MPSHPKLRVAFSLPNVSLGSPSWIMLGVCCLRVPSSTFAIRANLIQSRHAVKPFAHGAGWLTALSKSLVWSSIADALPGREWPTAVTRFTFEKRKFLQ